MRKLAISRRYSILFAVILILSGAAFAQDEKYSVPAKWESYSAREKNVSFLMPRLPVVIEQSESCRGEQSHDYAAYTDGAAYVVRITSKVKPPDYCDRKRNFDENNFSDRIKDVKTEFRDDSKTEGKISEEAVIKITGSGKIVKLVNDYKNKRWFEFAVYGADEKKDAVKNFLAALKTDETAAGINIGQGAERTYGDDSGVTEEVKIERDGKPETVKKLLVKIEDQSAIPIRVILKPRASYTEAARRSSVQGRVVLRATFKANGGVGDISVIVGLGSGLTEEAIKAAQKIVFIPAQRDGRRYSVSKPVEYSFTIY